MKTSILLRGDLRFEARRAAARKALVSEEYIGVLRQLNYYFKPQLSKHAAKRRGESVVSEEYIGFSKASTIKKAA